jgi:hypothetical protein
MTVAEFLAWVPPGEWGLCELIDGEPRRRLYTLRETDVVAGTPEELCRRLDRIERERS